MNALEFKIINQIADLTPDFHEKFIAMDRRSSLKLQGAFVSGHQAQPLARYQGVAAVEGADPNVAFGYLTPTYLASCYVFSLLVGPNWAEMDLHFRDTTILPKNNPPLAIRLPTETELRGIEETIRRGAHLSSSLAFFDRPKDGGASLLKRQLDLFKLQA